MSREISVDIKFLKVDEYIDAKEITAAMKLLEEIIEQEPSYGRAYNHLGWIYQTRMNDYRQAERYYKQAITFEFSYAASHINYSMLLQSQKRHEELELLLDKALNVVGIDKVFIYNEYAVMYTEQKKYKKAISSLKKAIFYCTDTERVQTFYSNIMYTKDKAGIFSLVFWS